ncbi:MAG: hypothetical protein M0R70_04200 [Nitrospirae bacterium]|nr:hypothetical protein [Nitrospirota bacterium]
MERDKVGGFKTPVKNTPPWAHWLLPSLQDALFIVVFLFLILGGKDLLGDADTGWHIGAGRYILETGTVPDTGIYSYTAAKMPWMAHEWLTELLFAIIHKVAGLNGIVLLAALAIAFTHSIFYGFLLSRGVSTVLALILTIAAMAATSVHWLARPHILSMPILLFWYMALEEYRLRGRRYIYLLPVVTIIWVNLHGGFMAGLLLVAVYWLGSLAEFFFSKDEKARADQKKQVINYGKVGLLATAAALVNPHGYQALLFPFRIMGQELNVGRINEWLSPNFHGVLPYEYVLLALIAVLGFSLLRFGFIEAGLVILWTHLSLHSVRYGPIFAIIVIPLMAIRLEALMKDGRAGGSRLVRGVSVFSERLQQTSASLKGHALQIIVILSVTAITITGGSVLGTPLLTHEFDKKNLPVAAVEFAERSGIQGRLFNTYHFGGYLIYKGFPKDGVFVDGRADMYNEFLKNYFDVVDVKPEWKDILARFDIDWLLITANSPLSVLLLETDTWSLVYADKVANVFVRNGSVNAGLTEKYKNVKLAPVDEKKQ